MADPVDELLRYNPQYLRARLAEVEAERDEARRRKLKWESSAAKAMAERDALAERLRRVEAWARMYASEALPADEKLWEILNDDG